MKLIYFILLIALIASCTQAVKIKNSGTEKDIINNAYIRTTEITINDAAKEVIQEPEIYITTPQNGKMINDSTIIVKLNISNFKLVTPDLYPKKGQGHVQVWVDGMEFRGSKTEFVFENESNGTHTIKAELMMSNNTVLPYSNTIKIYINKTY